MHLGYKTITLQPIIFITYVDLHEHRSLSLKCFVIFFLCLCESARDECDGDECEVMQNSV